MVSLHLRALLCVLPAFVLLTLTTFSIPFISAFYFLDTSIDGGVRFGIWGFCFDNDPLNCTPKNLGYSWGDEVIGWMTQTMVLIPISAALSLFAMLCIIPHLCTHKRDKIYPPPFYSFFAFVAFWTSLLGFIFLMVLWGTAFSRFKALGFKAHFGPLPWMSLAAMLLLLVATIGSGCGQLCRGYYGRQTRYYPYSV